VFFQIYIFFLQIRNLFPYYTGPTLIRCINNEHYGKQIYKLTVGKDYKSERRDRISYYVKDDDGVLQEIVKTNFVLIKKVK